MPDNTIEFGELGTKPGQEIEICADPSTQNVHPCVFVGVIPEEALVLTANNEGFFPELTEGQRILIRIRTESGIAFFPTTVLLISMEPIFMVYIDSPASVKFKQIRSAARVDVKLPILASNTKEGGLANAAGVMLDISATGCRIEVDKRLALSNDTIQVKGKFDVGNIQRILSIQAGVRSKTECKTDPTHAIYGVQFLEGDEENTLVLFGFIFNRMAFGPVQLIK